MKKKNKRDIILILIFTILIYLLNTFITMTAITYINVTSFFFATKGMFTIMMISTLFLADKAYSNKVIKLLIFIFFMFGITSSCVCLLLIKV